MPKNPQDVTVREKAEAEYWKRDGLICNDPEHGPIGEDAWGPRWQLDCSECCINMIVDVMNGEHPEA